jgi:hypothetical protein
VSASTAALLRRYRRAGVLVDTNVLLLLVVGAYDRALVPRFKRTAQYTLEDFDLAMHLTRRFARVVTTAGILTEVSNLAGQLGGEVRAACFAVFARNIQLLDEHAVASAAVARTPEFVRFGLTDAAILAVAQDRYPVLTDDFRLAGYMESRDLPVLNFTHLRAPNLFR